MDVIEHHVEYLVTKSTLRKMSGDELFALIRERKTSGVLKVEFVGGGIRSISLSEKASTADREEIRKILKIV